MKRYITKAFWGNGNVSTDKHETALMAKGVAHRIWKEYRASEGPNGYLKESQAIEVEGFKKTVIARFTGLSKLDRLRVENYSDKPRKLYKTTDDYKQEIKELKAENEALKEKLEKFKETRKNDILHYLDKIKELEDKVKNKGV